MRIDPTNKTTKLTKSKQTKRSSSADGFSIDISQETEETSAVSPVVQSQNVDALIALQMVENDGGAKQRNISRSQQLLDMLDELRIDLLTGRLSPGRIEHILSILENRHPSQDKQLEALVDEVELRARVELAKISR